MKFRENTTHNSQRLIYVPFLKIVLFLTLKIPAAKTEFWTRTGSDLFASVAQILPRKPPHIPFLSALKKRPKLHENEREKNEI